MKLSAKQSSGLTKRTSSSCWSFSDSTINDQNLLRQFGLHWKCCFGHFELKRKQKVSWFVRNVIMQSLEYKWQNWQYIKKTNKINSRFHRDDKPTDLTSLTWGWRRGRMRSQSRPNLNRSPRRRRPENVCILSSLIKLHQWLKLVSGHPCTVRQWADWVRSPHMASSSSCSSSSSIRSLLSQFSS